MCGVHNRAQGKDATSPSVMLGISLTMLLQTLALVQKHCHLYPYSLTGPYMTMTVARTWNFEFRTRCHRRLLALRYILAFIRCITTPTGPG